MSHVDVRSIALVHRLLSQYISCGVLLFTIFDEEVKR